jgi:hypothetical protein
VDKTFASMQPILNTIKDVPDSENPFKSQDKEVLNDEKFASFQKEMKSFFKEWDQSMNNMYKKTTEFGKLDKTFEHRLDAFEAIDASHLDAEEDHYDELAKQALAKTVEFRTRYHDQLSNRFKSMGKLDSIKAGLEKIEADRATHIQRAEAVVEDFKTMKMSFFKKQKKN